MVSTNRCLVKLFRKDRYDVIKETITDWHEITTDSKHKGVFINNQKLVYLLCVPLTRKHEIWSDAFSKSLSILNYKRKKNIIFTYILVLTFRRYYYYTGVTKD